jgi:ribosomal protein S18 acetylase RimI-like enzyme
MLGECQLIEEIPLFLPNGWSVATTRPVAESDEDFLRAVYASTRVEDIALLDWDLTQQEDFLNSQFQARQRYLATYFPDADGQMVLVDNQPAGYLYVSKAGGAVQVLDIALLPEYRCVGIGTALMTALMSDAAELNQPVQSYVAQYNYRALRFYKRLGFSEVDDRGLHYLMEWEPIRG